MSNIFKGIGQAISAIFPVEPKTLDDQLGVEAEALTGEREKIKPSRDDSNTFGWITHEHNPAHYLVERARAMGFRDTPIRGAHTAAYAEQFIEGVVQRMREFWGADIKIVEQKTEFPDPLYPEERVLWEAKRFQRKGDRIDLYVEGTAKSGTIARVKSSLAPKNPNAPEIAGPIYSRKYFIDPTQIDAFYRIVGGRVEPRVTNMFAAAFVPSTLLRLLEDISETNEGINRSMAFDFIREAKPGMLQVDIFPPRAPVAVYRRQTKIDASTGQPEVNTQTNQPVYETATLDGRPIVDFYAYKFRAMVSQGTKPITYGEIVSAVSPAIATKINSRLLIG